MLCYSSSSLTHIPLILVCHRWRTCTCACSYCYNNDKMSFLFSQSPAPKEPYSTVNIWIWKKTKNKTRSTTGLAGWSFYISCILIIFSYFSLSPTCLSHSLTVSASLFPLRSPPGELSAPCPRAESHCDPASRKLDGWYCFGHTPRWGWRHVCCCFWNVLGHFLSVSMNNSYNTSIHPYPSHWFIQ